MTMLPLLFDKVEIRKPRYDPHPEKSKTNNLEWRKGLFIIFKDYEGNTFDWMPRWKDLDKLMNYKEAVEQINSELAKQKYQEVRR